MPLDPQLLFDALLKAGIRGFSGVPCSILNDLICEAEASSKVDYVAASVEGEAVAAAAGSWLAGGLGVAMMQNSGLGNAVNPLASLAIPYEIPLLLLVSWRGEPGRKDAVHHYPMGAATPGLLELLGIPTAVLREDSNVQRSVADAVAYMEKERRPAALIVPRGLFEAVPGARARGRVPTRERSAEQRQAGRVSRFGGGSLPSRTDVLAAYLARCGDEAAVSTTGYMSREVASHALVDRHFPMQGSMGFAAAIALGIARQRPERPVFVLDGDGALIMRLGSLATIGALAPPRFVHLVIDNATYASTGGQRTVSPSVDFAEVALACGYAGAGFCSGSDGLAAALDWARESLGAGPTLLHIRVDERESSGLERPALTPPEIAQAFRVGLMGRA